MTYSLGFRQRVLAYKEKHNLTYRQTSKRFDIPIRNLFRWSKKIVPCTTRNKPATKINMDALLEDIEKHPNGYQWERAKRLNVGQPAIHYALKRLNIIYKRTLKHSKVDKEVRDTSA